MSPTALVTGASAGVGRATAEALARAGYDVALVARGEAGLAAAACEVKAAGARAVAVTADVSRFDEVQEASRRAEDELGPVSIWVNNAMTTVFAPVGEVSPQDFRRAMEVTFLGQVWGTMAALEAMKRHGKGTIVNVGSALAFIGIPLQAPYCAAKFACRGFFESVRAELLHEGSDIRMSMVHLPAVNTPQFGWCKSVFSRHPQPVPPIYQPEVCARAIVETALDGRRERVVGSWNRLLVWGARAIPGVGNQFAALGAWDEQLSDVCADPHRPSNLVDPVDETDDGGAHGIFDDRASGVVTPSFLRSLPRAAQNFARAVRATAHERKVSHDQRQARRVYA
jgi:NAD(P)-dependent dehydrogenase (short-subunit alcohol dehydrogenase family)